ncbi:sulfate adenylyltransferase [Neisseria sp. N95_16]|uniref:Sulfate adenylyltransferase n=1 Tax=Neisseria brasiliensis TaxID=2666100 RepID=A0A5Q3S1C3_9NEIS|nr:MULTISPECIES: GTP-binding protein [Neisseria]MRN37240.1 sulfate adenylyltransferase [Neisseria brasiliensis]PJO09559.1 sulfate adenylyltransferase [Neisseria sp. N95_16]PJO77623.1 sulfate adenylyltransferase [Neisseria sp. N177_16]QGL25772.1 sulfate adenylyltransferase [Neisseria brasiliensis]
MTATTAPLLRFITAGSVDDGKSTLIGRLLYDSKTLLTDQIDKLNKASENGDTPDFASLTDGLAAEREQGITIDVAYRYFATPKRKFIIADTPGHEQYTRNMVTGASTADAAIVLVDATRVDFSGEEPVLLPQTKCHSAILKLLGCPNIIVAVNKLDLLDFDESKYQAITAAYQKLAQQIGLTADVHFLPISALKGDNIVNASAQTPWHQGLPLLPLLESLPVSRKDALAQATHFPVQRVARQDGSSSDDFRGYQGRLEAGRLKVGDAVKVLPNGQTAKIAEIYNPNGKTDTAEAGEVLTITLDTDIDISRGNAIVAADSPVAPSQQFQAALCWFDDIPLNPRRKYLLKHTTQTAAVKISEIAYVWDVNTLSQVQSATELKLNDIGSVSLKTQQPLNATTYEQSPATGAFIIIDEATNHTVAAGMIRGGDEADTFEI